MASSLEERKRHLQDNFDPKGYWEKISAFGPGLLEEENKFFYEVNAKIFENPNLRGTTMIDIGCGPTIHNLAPACAHFSHIVVGDFVHANCEAVEKWLRNDVDALDWSKVLGHAAKALGYEDVQNGVEEIGALIRKKVKAVIHMNVLADKIVPPEYDVPYDLVFTSLVIETSSPDHATYKQCLKKINKLVKLGGHLVMRGVTMSGPWKAGEVYFPCLKISADDAKNALKEAGFEEIFWDSIARKDKDYCVEYESFFYVHCTKIRECSVV